MLVQAQSQHVATRPDRELPNHMTIQGKYVLQSSSTERVPRKMNLALFRHSRFNGAHHHQRRGFGLSFGHERLLRRDESRYPGMSRVVLGPSHAGLLVQVIDLRPDLVISDGLKILLWKRSNVRSCPHLSLKRERAR